LLEDSVMFYNKTNIAKLIIGNECMFGVLVIVSMVKENFMFTTKL